MKTVLLVDDDEIANFLNSKVLQQTGLAMEIHSARNGQQAITVINEDFQGSQTLPDVILLDINMPIMNGFEFIEAFHRLTIPGIDTVKIVIVSSSQDERDRMHAIELGVNCFLTKPIKSEELKRILSDN